MSNKTSFKRIALVAVSALGFGLISAVPSQSAVVGLTATATTSTGLADTSTVDSTTAATVAVRFLAQTSASETVGVTFALNSYPTTYTPATTDWNYALLDTLTATSASTIAGGVTKIFKTNADSSTLATGSTLGAGSNNTYAAGNFGIFGYSGTNANSNITAGTYTFSYVLTPYVSGVAQTGVVTGTVSYVVAALASASNVANAAASSIYIAQYATCQTGQTTDSAVSVLATASATARACIQVNLKNAASGTGSTMESVTATTTVGTVGLNTANSARGKSVVMKWSDVNTYGIGVFSDGTAGTASITVSSTSVTFPAKTAVFYSATVAKIVGTQRAKTITSSTNSAAITAVATDANGNVNGSSAAVYIFSDATTVVSESYTACAFSSTLGYHTCTLTGVSAGTAKITLGNSDKSIVSDVFTVVVTPAGVVPNTVSVTFDKASYAPNEKGYVIISLKDATGGAVAATSLANVFATGGISTTSNLASAPSTSIVDSLAATTVSTAWKTASSGYVSLDPIALIPFFAPATGGTITLSATGGTALAAAGRVAVTATATVTDNAATALAAVTALASQVSAFITKINAQITTLTDLVMKIQKKVKA